MHSLPICTQHGHQHRLTITRGCIDTICRFGVNSLPICTQHGHQHRLTATRGCIDTICLSWWWARYARNMLRVINRNKYIERNLCVTLAIYQETLHDAGSTKYTIWLGVNSQPAQDTATNTEWQLPEAVLIQFVSPDDEHDMLETCREL